MKEKRWIFIPLGIILFITLGTVYSWSVFRKPLEELLNIGATQSGLPYMFFLAFYALFMFISGPFIDKFTPRWMIIFGGILVGSGWILSSFASNITALTITYGVVAGSGVGVIYGVPVAVVSKWFYEKKGLAVGLILSGFGLSPLITAPLAEFLIEGYGPLKTFRILGIIFLLTILVLSIPFKFPDKEYNPQDSISKDNVKLKREVSTKDLFKEKVFYGLWICFALGTLIGLMTVGITSSVGIEIVNLEVRTTAILLSFFAIFNGVGRPIFGWLTDKTSPRFTATLSYSIIILTSSMMLIAGDNVFVYIISFSFIWMTLGSWLAIAPTATGRYFGQKNQSRNYGVVFTAYGVGAVLGVSLSGYFRDVFGSYIYIFYPMIVIAIMGIAAAWIFMPKRTIQ